MIRFAHIIALVGMALTGCNPYDPSLPNAPFRCGTVEPKCPDGFTCKVYSADYQVCEGGNATATDASSDGAPFQCDPDSALEPNDAPANARSIPPRPLGEPFIFSQVAICPASDKDYFLITVDTNNLNVEVVVESSAGAVPMVQLLNSTNVPVANGAISGRSVRAFLANAPAGQYYAFVSASGQSNYKITVKLTQ